MIDKLREVSSSLHLETLCSRKGLTSILTYSKKEGKRGSLGLGRQNSALVKRNPTRTGNRFQSASQQLVDRDISVQAITIQAESA